MIAHAYPDLESLLCSYIIHADATRLHILKRLAKLESLYLLAGVGSGTVAAAEAAAAGCSSLGSGLKGSSFNGPLVALMPAAGLEAGISGMSRGAGFGGTAASAVVVAGTSVGLAEESVGASVEGVWASAAVGGAGTVAPTGSGAGRGGMLVYGYLKGR
jgi:hypothetical protein